MPRPLLTPEEKALKRHKRRSARVDHAAALDRFRELNKQKQILREKYDAPTRKTNPKGLNVRPR